MKKKKNKHSKLTKTLRVINAILSLATFVMAVYINIPKSDTITDIDTDKLIDSQTTDV